jgi:hypothetical protein
MSSTKDTDIRSPYLQSKVVSPCPIAGEEGLEWIQVHDTHPRPSLHCATSTELHRNSLIPPYRHNRSEHKQKERNLRCERHGRGSMEHKTDMASGSTAYLKAATAVLVGRNESSRRRGKTNSRGVGVSTSCVGTQRGLG